jgi:hypothetical protein
MWIHIIKYIPYPSKQLYKVIHNTTAYKRLYTKSIISIQRFYRRHRAPRFEDELLSIGKKDREYIKNCVEECYRKQITEYISKHFKKILIRSYITQYPINSIENLVYLFNKKLTYFSICEDEKFKKLSLLRRLYICLDKCSLYDLDYVTIFDRWWST